MTTLFERVIPFCEKVMESHKNNKGDSWRTCDHQYLLHKLHEEYAEVVLDPYNPKELADLINIASMILYRYVPSQKKEGY